MGNQGQAGKPTTQPEATDSESNTNIWTGFLATAGFVAMAGGALLAAGPRFIPEMAWIATSFARIGIESGAMIGSGVVCAGLAILTHQVHRVGLKMRAAEEAVRCTHALGQGMRHLVERLTSLHAELSELKAGHSAGLRILQESAKNETAGMQIDATYRLAASVDQIARRLEERFDTQESTQTVSLTELSRSILESQDQLLEIFEESRLPDEEFEEQDLLEAAFENEPQLPETPEEPLEITVELEKPGPEAEQKIDVSAFDWDDVKVPERQQDKNEEPSLGLLDDLDSVPPVAPSEASTEGNWPAAAPGEGVHMLDSMTDETNEEADTHDSIDAPPSLVRDADQPTAAPATEDTGTTNTDLEQAFQAFDGDEQG